MEKSYFSNETTKVSSNNIHTNQTFYEDIFLQKKIQTPKKKEKKEKENLIKCLSSENSIYQSIKKEKKEKVNLIKFLLSENSIYQSIKKEKKKIKKKIKKKKQIGCRCKISNCLRLHCKCFSILGYCSKLCKCQNCLNNKNFKIPRDFVIKKTKLINKNAFKSEKNKFKIVNGFKINLDGCNCSKGCFNDYCGCRKNGGNCSPICRCQNCKNFKIKIERNLIRNIYKPVFRTKDKIIIDFDKSFVKVKKIFKRKIYFVVFFLFFFIVNLVFFLLD